MGRLDHGDLLQRAENLAVDTITYLREQDFQKQDIRLYGQLTASITSVASNIAEANGAISKKEFIRILQISLREAYEASMQIRIYSRAFGLKMTNIYDELQEMIKIIVAISKASLGV